MHPRGRQSRDRSYLSELQGIGRAEPGIVVDEGLQRRRRVAPAVVTGWHALLQLERRVRVNVLRVLCNHEIDVLDMV